MLAMRTGLCCHTATYHCALWTQAGSLLPVEVWCRPWPALRTGQPEEGSNGQQQPIGTGAGLVRGNHLR